MGIAALVAWLLTAVGGFYMLATWITKGGPRQPRTTRFPPAVIFGHFALAVIGLVIWIIYLVSDADALAWVAFALLIPVAALGFVMLVRWIPTYRAHTPQAAVGARTAVGTHTSEDASTVPEKHFSVVVVAGHGLFAAITEVLVLLTALGVGGS
ncbi:hypothetical protein HYG77_32245 (plasmid) [Rhodococcus sp. ZPP]|uniref:hypothetical protein n=1 Tax=Rhodococcus sp. ZPP TaxID=2749906 RepID=UPI001AD85373|nr:hypothetical protein [Rhodococcus sp. ZPP]QTJ70243.1 hypothetical protein HYG77_32245 [Rhodococcus sp. ZPP]